MKPFRYYLLNCFMLTIPILLWNVFFYPLLPDAFQPGIFWNDIPLWFTYSENSTRILLFIVTFFMPLSISTPRQKLGLIVYCLGVSIYFLSWVPLFNMVDEGVDGISLLHFMAPAYTPAIWLLGICLIGDKYYFKFPFSKYLLPIISVIFLVCHNYHTWIIFVRTH